MENEVKQVTLSAELRKNLKVDAGDLLHAAANLFDDRKKVYGLNYKKVGPIMNALFPDGIPLKTIDDHNRFHIFMLQIVKITRYAENWSKGGHGDSMADISVYAAMLQAIDKEINDQ